MTDLDSFDIYRETPTFQQRIAMEKQINVYYLPGVSHSGHPHFAYAVCSALLHEAFVACVKLGEIPDYAVVVETGSGEPTDEIKEKIKRYYGFDHDAAQVNKNNS